MTSVIQQGQLRQTAISVIHCPGRQSAVFSLHQRREKVLTRVRLKLTMYWWLVVYHHQPPSTSIPLHQPLDLNSEQTQLRSLLSYLSEDMKVLFLRNQGFPFWSSESVSEPGPCYRSQANWLYKISVNIIPEILHQQKGLFY